MQARKTDVWILIPVHNRRETTRLCLENLASQDLFAKYTVCVIDDGCTDGTAEMVAGKFPQVLRLSGNGNLYWGGGIAHGMRKATDSDAKVHVWLNDDCLPDRGSIELTVDRVLVTKGMCGAVCRESPDSEKFSYGGSRSGDSGPVRLRLGEFATVDAMNGNLVAVHSDVVASIGILDAGNFPHYGGDIAYTMIAKRRGFATEIAGSATAVNPRDDPFRRFGTDRPPNDILKEPFRTGSILYWPTYWRLLRLSYGWLAFLRWPAYLLRLASLYVRALRRQRTAD